jgi:peptide/nickel transport system substrate-binding protein
VSFSVQGVFVVAMNNDIFPLEMRKAMSYAFNYSDYNEMMFEGRFIRAKSPLPKGMLYSNWSLNVAYTNLTIARQTLIDVAWPGTGVLTANDNVSVGNEWEKLVEDDTPLETYNFSIEEDRGSHIFQVSLLKKYFKQIGIKIVQVNLTPQDWWQKLIRGELEFYASGWGAAFNDPVEMLNPLYLDYGDFNHYNFSDAQVQTWILEGMTELNETARQQIYYNIQKKLVEELYPVIWTHYRVLWDVWASNVKGIPIEGVHFKMVLKYAYFEEA